jgi:DNA modification methylase
MSVIHGDCLDVMAGMDPESVDAIVTDPPYGLGFMGKAWDDPDKTADVPMRRRPELDAVNVGMSRQGGRQWSGTDGQKRQARDMRTYGQWCESWAAECLRVAKPSSYLLAFGGTRTVHRMTVALEDAGWIIRDMLVWAYASGFPKSKASLKPAWEPIVMARKPGPLRMLAIDECRIGTEPMPHIPGELGAHGVYGRMTRAGEASAERRYPEGTFAATPGVRGGDPAGRWPANVILTDPIFDGGVEGVVGGGMASDGGAAGVKGSSGFAGGYDGEYTVPYGDSGTYSRFFLIPKADRSDREPVLGGGPTRVVSVWGGDEDDLTPGKKSTVPRQNVHPTVKPTDLMRHLVRLVTPTGGVVLDPFLGSGTTALAAEMEGFSWIGIEREAEYVAIAEARLNGTQRGLGLESA